MLEVDHVICWPKYESVRINLSWPLESEPQLMYQLLPEVVLASPEALEEIDLSIYYCFLTAKGLLAAWR